MVGWSPQISQDARFFSLMVRKFIVLASKVSNRSVSSSPTPRKYFNASAAWMVPSIPAMAPRTPAWLLVGTVPAGGGSLKKQR